MAIFFPGEPGLIIFFIGCFLSPVHIFLENWHRYFTGHVSFLLVTQSTEGSKRNYVVTLVNVSIFV